jgi:hypothetical protein
MNQDQNQPSRRHRRRRRRKGGQGPKPQGQPGNQSQPPQGGKPQFGGGPRGGGGRGRRGRRPAAAFVGPMDHSYRNNGNQAGNQPGGPRRLPPGYPPPTFEHPELEPVRAAQDDVTRIYAFVDDLFFVAKMNETARKLNIKLEFVKDEKAFSDRLEEMPEEEKPSLIIVDLNSNTVKPLTLISKLRGKVRKGTSIVGFLSHLQGELKLKAQEAGCDVVMPRSAFSQSLPVMLRRHGAPEELEMAD